MSCRNDTSFSLYFPNSGIEVVATEADIRDQRRKFSVGEFRTTRTAGDLVAENVPHYSPVAVRIGGQRTRWMMYGADSLTFERNLDEDDVCDIQLVDPTRVLSRGTVTKRFSSVTLDEVVRYLMKQVNDENNVLQGLEYVEESNPLEERDIHTGATLVEGLIGGSAAELIAEETDTDVPYLDDVWDFLDGVGESVSEKLFGDTYTGFEFESVTPLEAMMEVINEFELDWWVGRDGVLHLGLDGTRGQVVGVLDESDAIKLNRYAVTSDPDMVNSVYLEGPYTTIDQNLDRVQPAQVEYLVMMAEATDPTSNGTQATGDPGKGVNTLEELEQAAQRQLIRQMMDMQNGSIEINGLSSTDTEALINLDIGDVISVEDNVSIACDKDLLTGAFIVRGLDHKSSPRRGWSISVDVARVPNVSQIETTSVLYSPTADKRYDDLEHFQESDDPGNIIQSTIDDIV